MLTENGKFKLAHDQTDGICLSISSLHPESWNPAWKVTQIVLGLQTFWYQDEYTYGSVDSYDYDEEEMSLEERSVGFAMKSGAEVLKNEKFQEIFGDYADAIGITKQEMLPEWIKHQEILDKKEAEKKAAEEAERIRQEEERKAEEERLRLIEIEEQKKREANAIKDYFKLLKQKNLTKYIGKPGQVKKIHNRLMA